MGGYALGHYSLSPTVRRRLNRCAGCGLTLAAVLMAATGWAATYRWVDGQGGVHYGDRIPVQYAGAQHEELDGQGRVIRRVGSYAERQKQAAIATQETAEALAAKERQRSDNALLSTFGSAQEIDQARDRLLAQERTSLNGLKVQRKQNPPAAEIARLDALILQRYQRMEAILLQYKTDRARYIELTGRR